MSEGEPILKSEPVKNAAKFVGILLAVGIGFRIFEGLAELYQENFLIPPLGKN